MQVLLPILLRHQDVLSLCPYVSAAKQNDQQGASPAEIESIARTKIDAHLFDTVAYRLTVAEISQSNSIEARTDNTNCTAISQRREPVQERRRWTLSVQENLDLPGHNL